MGRLHYSYRSRESSIRHENMSKVPFMLTWMESNAWLSAPSDSCPLGASRIDSYELYADSVPSTYNAGTTCVSTSIIIISSILSKSLMFVLPIA